MHVRRSKAAGTPAGHQPQHRGHLQASACAPIGVPTPGVAVSAEDLHRLFTQLVEGANGHASRLDLLERESKMIGDALGTVGRHCQASSAELRGHLASSSADLGKAMQAVDAALRATIEAAQDRFAEF